MMHVIINDGLHDADYVARYTVGFDQLREKVQEYPPERVAEVDGHCGGGHCQAGPRVCDHPPGGDPGELWRAAFRGRRHGHARHHHAALRHRLVEGSRRRASAFDQRRFWAEPRSAGARRSDGESPGKAGAHHQHGGAGHGAQQRWTARPSRRSSFTTRIRPRSVPTITRSFGDCSVRIYSP